MPFQNIYKRDKRTIVIHVFDHIVVNFHTRPFQRFWFLHWFAKRHMEMFFVSCIILMDSIVHFEQNERILLVELPGGVYRGIFVRNIYKFLRFKNSYFSNIGAVWSYFPAPSIRRKALFCKFISRSRIYEKVLPHTVMQYVIYGYMNA